MGYRPANAHKARVKASEEKAQKTLWRKAECAMRQHAAEGNLEALRAVAEAAANDYSAEEVRIMLAVTGTVERACFSLDGTARGTAACGVTGVFVTSETSYDASLNRFKVVRMDAGIGGRYATARREASALHFAVVERHWPVVAFLLSKGCDANSPAACTASAAFMAKTNRTSAHLTKATPDTTTEVSEGPSSDDDTPRPLNPLQDRAFLDSATACKAPTKVQAPETRPTTASSVVLRHNANRAGLNKLTRNGSRGGLTSAREADVRHKEALLTNGADATFGTVVESDDDSDDAPQGHAGAGTTWQPAPTLFTPAAPPPRRFSRNISFKEAEASDGTASDVGFNPLGKTVYDPEFEVQLREEKLRERSGPRLTKARLQSAQSFHHEKTRPRQPPRRSSALQPRARLPTHHETKEYQQEMSLARKASLLRSKLDDFVKANPSGPKLYPREDNGKDATPPVRSGSSSKPKKSLLQEFHDRQRTTVQRPEEWESWIDDSTKRRGSAAKNLAVQMQRSL